MSTAITSVLIVARYRTFPSPRHHGKMLLLFETSHLAPLPAKASGRRRNTPVSTARSNETLV